MKDQNLDPVRKSMLNFRQQNRRKAKGKERRGEKIGGERKKKVTAKNGKRSRIDGEKRKSIRNRCDSKQGQDHHSLFVPSFLSELEKLCFGGTAFS